MPSYAIIKDGKGGYSVKEVKRISTYEVTFSDKTRCVLWVCFLLDDSITTRQAADAALVNMYPYLNSIFYTLLGLKDIIK